jgi:hypothetical protein
MYRKAAFISGAVVRSTLMLAAVLTLVATASGSAMATSVVAKSGKAIATARIDGFTPSIVTFGGSKTKAATVAKLGAGDYQVTFTGNYPKGINANSLILNSTAESSIFAVSNAVVDSASSATLVIEVSTFDPFLEDDEDNNCFVAVYFGD